MVRSKKDPNMKKFKLLFIFAVFSNLMVGSATYGAQFNQNDMTKVMETAISTLSTLSGAALSSLNEVNVRYENFSSVANVTMRSNGTTVKYRCLKDEQGAVECSAFKRATELDIVE